MSDEDSDHDKRKVEDPMPPHKIRFTDLDGPLVEKAIRCKF
jgi:hypothetical protein